LDVSLLVKKGRIESLGPLAAWFELALGRSGVELLPLTPAIVQRASRP
jgi:PIN domain nuclease of toxin-antitoxin system